MEFDDVVEYMKTLGWVETKDRIVRHPGLEQDFAGWEDAIKSTLQVGTPE